MPASVALEKRKLIEFLTDFLDVLDRNFTTTDLRDPHPIPHEKGLAYGDGVDEMRFVQASERAFGQQSALFKLC